MRFKLLLILLAFLFAGKPTFAIYDPLSVPNNKFGVHILETIELPKAAQLVNSSGGDWGYVTIPIRANERDLAKWTKFMEDGKKLHVIPILRLASFPVDDYWMAPNELDIVDFANFLNDLPWPTKNRYVVIYNEPNHKNEWGGFVYPQEYAHVLEQALEIFHKKNADFFVIPAGFDSSAPNSNNSMNEYVYMQIMNETVPGIFSKVDGFSSHSYGNPGFSSRPNIYSPVSVANYRFEEGVLQAFGVAQPKLFITEAGWHDYSQYFTYTFQNIWTDENIVAITPFVLNAQAGPFSSFSFLNQDGSFKEFAKIIQLMPKITGNPRLNLNSTKIAANIKPVWTGSLPQTSKSDLISSLKAIFSRIFNLRI